MSSNTKMETFNMGEFSLDDTKQQSTISSKESGNDFLSRQKKDLKDSDVNKPMIKREMKEVVKEITRPDDEQLKHHQNLVIMLSRYGSSKRFGTFLKEMSFDLSVNKLKKLDVNELEELLVRVKTSVNQKNVSNFWEELVLGLVQTGEVLTVSTSLGKRFKIQGLHDVLKNDPNFLDILEQIQLDHQNLTYASPETRLIYCVVTSAMKCHSVNSMMEKRLKMYEKDETAEDQVDKQPPVNNDDLPLDESKEKSSPPQCAISFDD
jgi:hypothetical protein